MSALLLLMRFSPETSWYQRLKLTLMEVLPLTKDALHVYLGCLCLLLTALLLRRDLASYRLLLPGLLLSLAMEAQDLRDDRRSEGRFRWGASAHDVVNTNLLPLVIVSLSRRRLQQAR